MRLEHLALGKARPSAAEKVKQRRGGPGHTPAHTSPAVRWYCCNKMSLPTLPGPPSRLLGSLREESGGKC